MHETVKKLCQDFFIRLWVDYSELQIENQENNIFKISLKSEDSHLLIGPHGKNLETLTHLLKLLFSKHCEWYITIHLEVNDYMKQKDEKLRTFINSKIQLVKENWKEIVLPFFSSYERKKVHWYVTESGWNIYTQSRWEGNERRIYLCKKDNTMSIDIDWDDI